MRIARIDRRRLLRTTALLGFIVGIGLITIGVMDAAPPPGGYQLMKVAASGGAFVDPEKVPAVADDSETKKDLAEIKADVKAMRKMLEDALKEEPGTEKPASDEKALSAWNVAVKACVGCHGSDVALQKGDKFVMFQVSKSPDGKTVKADLRDDFSRGDIRRMITQVEDGTMPKKSSGKKLTSEQRAAFLGEMKARLDQVDGK